MFPPVELFIGTRYIHARRGNHFIASISLTAIIATTLGVAVLLTILSIMNGFEGELRGRLLGMAAHLEVDTRDPGAANWQRDLARIRATDEVAAAAPYLRRDVLVQHRGQVRAVEVRGIDIDSERDVTTLDAHVIDGKDTALVPGSFGVLIGRELADQLGLAVGDPMMLLSPQPLVTPAGLLPRMKRFTVAGIFEFGLHENDSELILIDRADAARLFRAHEQIDGIRVRLHDVAKTTMMKQQLMAALGVRVSDWSDTHRNLFRALKMEKLVMFVILALAIAIAAFNLVAILVVAVTEKRGDIAMLSALGLPRRAVMRIFLYQGGITGALGVSAGLAFGYLLAQNVDTVVSAVETLFGFRVLSPEVYYISRVPSDPRWPDFAITALLAGILAAAAPVYPAWLASRTAPAGALRHE